VTISPLGDSALLVDFSDESSSGRDLLDRALSAADRLSRAQLPGVDEVTSAYQSVAIFLDLAAIESHTGVPLTSELERQITEIASTPGDVETERRLIEVPVCYDAEFALDAQRVASESGLSFNSVVQLHAATEFTVACIGFMPGFPYLAGLPDALRLPRLATPRTKVPGGSVAIANGQAGIYPFESPGGWNIIGRACLPLFDPAKMPPALLRAGDRVKFREISRQEFKLSSSSRQQR
jgi:inhibitor of KinA